MRSWKGRWPMMNPSGVYLSARSELGPLGLKVATSKWMDLARTSSSGVTVGAKRGAVCAGARLGVVFCARASDAARAARSRRVLQTCMVSLLLNIQVRRTGDEVGSAIHHRSEE